jgi:hypothetical protein
MKGLEYLHSLCRLNSCVILAGSILTLHAPARSQVILRDQYPHLTFNLPVGVVPPNDSTDRLCVVEQGGVIRIAPRDSNATASKAFLDIHTNVISGGELGLLGLAFHPRYVANGYFYVDYTRNNPLRTVISRFRVSASNPDSADPASEFILLEQPQPFNNHNGGQLAFGPDGYLYIAFGDGGSGGDPFGNGQSTSTLLGKILRINVDTVSGTKHYAIPPDNPFHGDTTKKQEIFAYGLRNPWRFSFDRQTLWCADVGQDNWEEVDTIVSGGNYGWNVMEGFHCYSPSMGCIQTGLTLPIWEYSHDSGRCSITGGFVSRSPELPSLAGKYIYGDYCTGDIWVLTPGASNQYLLDAAFNISSFGEDRFGTIYVCNHGGKIYRLTTNLPGPFSLIAPADHALNRPNIVSFSWSASAGATAYEIQVALDSAFTPTVLRDTTVQGTGVQIGPLPDSTLLFWRVRAKNGGGSTPYSAFRRFTTASLSIPYHLMMSWNLVSLPLDVPDARTSALFPSAVSRAVVYDSAAGYTFRDTLIPRSGYWLRFGAAADIGVAGGARYADTIDVVPGWNMIGSISRPVPVTEISSIPAAMVTSHFFAYQGSYVAAASIDPGKGYWVKAVENGKLILSSSPAAGENPARVRIDPAMGPPPAPPDLDGQMASLPSEYLLDQNFPNPFNPGTVIQYAVPAAGHVSLEVFNLLGEEVAVVVDRMEEAGVKSVTWDAAGLPSGIYLYRLTSGRFTGVKKMMVVR